MAKRFVRLPLTAGRHGRAPVALPRQQRPRPQAPAWPQCWAGACRAWTQQEPSFPASNQSRAARPPEMRTSETRRSWCRPRRQKSAPPQLQRRPRRPASGCPGAHRGPSWRLHHCSSQPREQAAQCSPLTLLNRYRYLPAGGVAGRAFRSSPPECCGRLEQRASPPMGSAWASC